MPFLKLEDAIIHPLLSGFIALFFLLGWIGLISWGGKAFLKRDLERVEIACGFMMFLGFFATIIHFLALAHFINSWSLRIIGYPICLYGIYYAILNFSSVRVWGLRCYEVYKFGSIGHKVDILLLAGFLGLLFLSVLAPPTDADSLNYHIGFPLDMLRSGGFAPSKDWFHSRLIGLGEYLNLFGLGLGSDNFGAVLQFFGVCWCCLLIWDHSANSKYRLLLLKLVLCVPVLIFLVPNQKPQLIGVIALVASVILAVRNEKLEKSALILSLGSLFFAMSLKYNFYLTGSGILLLIGYKAKKSGQLGTSIALAAFFYSAFILPFHIVNYKYYGDPVSPLLSFILNPYGYEYMIMERLGDYRDNGFDMPLGLIVPSHAGVFPHTLGIGLFVIVFIRRINRQEKEFFILGLALYCFIIVALLGQLTSRTFLEPYYFLIAGMGSCNNMRTRGMKLFTTGLSLQLLCVFVSILVGTFTLFPGALSFSARENTMLSAAYNYAAMKWIDDNIPENSFLISEFRSNALLPRPFLASGYKRLIPEYNDDIANILTEKPNIENYYLVTTTEVGQNHPLSVSLEENPPIHRQFFPEKRNPFYKSGKYTLFIYTINRSKLLSQFSDN